MKSKNYFKILALFFLTFVSLGVIAQEICDNGIDDDGDSLVDLNDVDDCDCLNIGGGNNVVSSIIPNASFEDTDCCPDGISQLDCATTWIQASIPTSDYFNNCDYSPDFIQPIPDGDAAVGGFFVEDWAEYVGSCLIEPFNANEDYILQMNIMMAAVDGGVLNGIPLTTGPVDVTVYGTSDCNDLPWSTMGCPVGTGGNWMVIGSYTYEPDMEWQEISILLNAPVDITAVAIGPPCDLPDDYIWDTNNNGPFAVYDNLVLNEASLFSSNIDSDVYNEEFDVWVHNGSYINEAGELVTIGAICQDLITLTANVDTLGGYQWYYEGVAMIGETDTILSVLEEDFDYGEYQFVLSNPVSGECSTAAYIVSEPEIPTVDFSYTLNSLCFPATVDVIDGSSATSGLQNWSWYVDDVLVGQGNPTMSTNIITPGAHNVELILESNNFCTDSLTETITLASPPVVDFAVEQACIGEVTEFIDATTTDPGVTVTSWSWIFDDGNESVLQNPTNIFNDDDDFNVSLTVFDSNDCSSNIVVPISTYATPVIAFTNAPQCMDDPVAVFNNLSTIDMGTIDEFVWDFGDTEGDVAINTTHVYGASGTYPITLTGTSDQGCVGVGIGEQIIAEVTTDFTFDIGEGCSPLCVDFIGQATTSHGAISDFVWTFDNGTTNSGQIIDRCFYNDSHTDNIYHGAELIAINEYGCQTQVSYDNIIEVWPVPFAEFSSESYTELFIDPVFYYDNTSIGASQYVWDFGDGSSSNSFEAPHTYNDLDIYDVMLTVYSDKGCTDEMLRSYEVKPFYTIFIPNTFTPQEDGLNDSFKPIVNGDYIKEYDFEIYDRWGNIVFKSNNPEESWNGSRLNEDTQYISDGLYAWAIKVRFTESTDVYKDNGTIVVTR